MICQTHMTPTLNEIKAKVSQEEWDAWREMQTKIINEYRLDLSEAADRQKLMKQMLIFFGLDKDTDSKLEVGTPT